VEQAAEIYKPNQMPEATVIRSQQSSESKSINGGNQASGVPGALANQPQPNASAPINGAPPAAAANGAPGTSTDTTGNMQKDITVNYEVDKTIRYVQQPMVGLKRLSVAVVVNHKQTFDKNGKPVSTPLTDAEKTQITDLVKEAMGYNKERGDSLNVVNTPFAMPAQEKIAEVPLWKQAETLQMAKDAGKYLLAALVLLYLFFKFLKPMLTNLAAPSVPALPRPQDDDDAVVSLGAPKPMLAGPRAYEDNLSAAKHLAKQDPKVVANVVKQWMGTNE
jgi:flagellar M-ring protein FliF